MVVSLGARGGRWDTEMGWEISPKVRLSTRGMFGRTQESAVGAFMTNEGYSIHGGYIVKVLSSGGVSGSKGWPLGY